ncbi:hypothetical protein [Synechococcus phage S-8S29]|nr:hypothetical protein [Synechococcus phage S-8S29]
MKQTRHVCVGNNYNTLTVPRQVFQFVTLRDLFIQLNTLHFCRVFCTS